MHDEQLSIAIKDAGETFEPPWVDVRALSRRGRRRWWVTRAGAATTALALTAGVAVAASRVELGTRPPAGAAAAAPAPTLRHWETIPAAPIAARSSAAAAWTGSELVVVGGIRRQPFNDGASFDPATSTWAEVPEAPGPEIYGADAVWTGRELIFWGGEDDDGGHEQPYTGRAYDPATRRWRALPDSPLDPETSPISFWTGEEVVVAGGMYRAGAAYDPAADRWRSIEPIPRLSERGGVPLRVHPDTIPVWTGSEAIVVTTAGVLAYHPDDDRWTREPAPEGAWRRGAAVVWTGDRLMVWSGRARSDAEPTPDGWIGRK